MDNVAASGISIRKIGSRQLCNRDRRSCRALLQNLGSSSRSGQISISSALSKRQSSAIDYTGGNAFISQRVGGICSYQRVPISAVKETLSQQIRPLRNCSGKWGGGGSIRRS